MQVKVGDRVFYYFLHALSDIPNPVSDGVKNTWTGRCEMRCRAAEVIAVLKVVPPAQFGMLVVQGTARVNLLVLFDPSDRIIVPGGVVLPPAPIQEGIPANDGDGSLCGSGWPMPKTWAFTSKMAN